MDHPHEDAPDASTHHVDDDESHPDAMNAADTRGAAYRGRFAPSPTGSLHFGSLVSALASFLDARAAGGVWLVRIEDLDPPREIPGAADNILRTLEALALEWDEAVVWQSHRAPLYAAALAHLRARGLSYPCGCSRKDIAAALRLQSGALPPAPGEEPAYPGTCRNGMPAGKVARAERFRMTGHDTGFTDLTQGDVRMIAPHTAGDFVLRRADGLFAYQLAVVVDDHAQGITHVVRGADLLDSTPRQIALQHALDVPTPRYRHVPVVTNAAGEKLSKQTRAKPVVADDAVRHLRNALAFLGQAVPPEMVGARARELLVWAIAHWRPDRIPRTRAIAGSA